MNLGYLPLRLAQRGWGSKCPRADLARYPPRKAEIGTMAGIPAFGTVAVGFTAKRKRTPVPL